MIAWIAAHWEEVLALIGAIFSVFRIVAHLTRNTIDDKIVAWLEPVLGIVLGRRK